MHRPSGWRPTAFYRPNGRSASYTNAAVLDETGRPVNAITDPVDSDGLLLIGPWVLTSYDERWGNARYTRPDEREQAERPFPLAPETTKEPRPNP